MLDDEFLTRRERKTLTELRYEQDLAVMPIKRENPKQVKVNLIQYLLILDYSTI